MKKMSTNCLRSQVGVTLTELLIAMAISMILLGGLYKVFFSSSDGYRQMQAMSRVQENGRFAVALLAQELRLAGTPKFYYDGTAFFGTPITGTEASGPGNSDSVTISWDTQAGYASTGAVFRTVAFTVDNTNGFTLMRQEDAGTAQPFIEGVENMQILYGEDTDADGSVDAYRKATAVTDWDEVIAIRVGLLMRSEDQVSGLDPDSSAYTVLDENITAPGDRRIRRLFTSTITLRNRLR